MAYHGRRLQDCIHPAHFYQLMEIELEKQPKLTRENFVPIFVCNVVREALSYDEDDNDVINSAVPSKNAERPTALPARSPGSSHSTNSTALDDESDAFEGKYLLPYNTRLIIERILQFALSARRIRGLGFDLVQFCLRFCVEIEFPCLELLWLLDSKYKLMSISAYLMKLKSTHQVDHFGCQLIAFCFSKCLHENSTGKSTEILNDILRCMFISAYCNPESNKALNTLRTVSADILTSITQKLISEDEDITQSTMNHKFLIEVLQGVPIMDTVKKRYFSCQLSTLLTQESKHSLSDTLQYQEKLATEELEKQRKQETIALFIGPPQTKSDIIEVLRKNLKDMKTSLNWENILLTITTWEKVDSLASFEVFHLMKDLIRALILIGVTEEKEDEIIVAFILARHCCLISPVNFSRYEKWFASMFEHENSVIKTSPKFTFFVQVLTKWVSVEPPSFLQVHVSYRPFIPPGCRNIWNEYCALVKTRIEEYNDVEEAMEYEPNKNNPVQYDVEMAIKSFDNLKKIPQAVLEQLFFRKQYFLDHFLPALIKKPSGTVFSDARLRLIEALNLEGKVPAHIYANHKANYQK